MQNIITYAAERAAEYFTYKRYRDGSRLNKSHRLRERRSVANVYTCLGDLYFRRAYRMTYETFWTLHDELKDGIKNAFNEAAKIRMRLMRRHRRLTRRGNNKNPIPPPPPNGKIDTSVRLACAIRYFAGGSPYDIITIFGISHSEMFNSVWYVVDAINKKKKFDIKYPESHHDQQKIADGLRAVSAVGFDCCAGAIDGILIWILRPTLDDAKAVGVDQQKFMCGRKHKFGLNCQAVSDVRGRILDISITCGGASSDIIAFEHSD